MTFLNADRGYYCPTCGARPRENCRAVMRRDNGHGQEMKSVHQARRENFYRPFAKAVAEKMRAELDEVWDD